MLSRQSVPYLAIGLWSMTAQTHTGAPMSRLMLGRHLLQS